MHKNATKCYETLSKWCKNKHGASKIIDTFETYQSLLGLCGVLTLERSRCLRREGIVPMKSDIVSVESEIFLVESGIVPMESKKV
jgi:hypothetical protein